MYLTPAGKVEVFPYGQYIVGNVRSLAFQGNSQVRGQSWGLRVICKNVTNSHFYIPSHTAANDIYMHGVTIFRQETP